MEATGGTSFTAVQMLNNSFFSLTPAVISAAGTTIGTAALMPGQYVIVNSSTVGTSVGVLLPNLGYNGAMFTIFNKSSNAISIFPPGAGIQIDSLGAGNPLSLAAGAQLLIGTSDNANQYYSIYNSGVGSPASLTINSSAISGGTSGRLLYDNAGTAGETIGLVWSTSTGVQNLTLGSSSTDRSNIIGISTLTVSVTNTGALILGNSVSTNLVGSSVYIYGQPTGGGGAAGSVTIQAGTSVVGAGGILNFAAAGPTSSGGGGFYLSMPYGATSSTVQILGGIAGNTGNIYLTGFNSTVGAQPPGSIFLTGGNQLAGGANGGSITLTGGNQLAGGANGGSITLVGGVSTASNAGGSINFNVASTANSAVVQTKMTVSPAINGVQLQNNALLYFTNNTNITATGTTLATAFTLTNQYNIVTFTYPGGSGVSLPTPGAAGTDITIINKGTNSLSVYPNSASASIDSGAAGAAITLTAGSQLIVVSSSTSQWSTVLNTGNLGGGTPTQVNATSATTTGTYYILGASTWGTAATITITTTSKAVSFNPANGIVQAIDFIATSDARYKDVTGKLENAVNSIKKLNGVKYLWNDLARQRKGVSTSESQVGLIAQDVQIVLPEAVGGEPDDLGVKYDKIVPLLVEAIKELAERIDRLEKR